MGVYCDSDDVRRAAAQSDPWNEEQTAAVGNWIERASAMVDRWTGTWFDDRTHLVRTRTVTEDQHPLFLPAPLIQLQSLEIDGVALDVAEDVVSLGAWLERADSSAWRCTKPLGIVIVGVFGYAVVPGPITEYTATLAATLGGFKVRGGMAGDGTFQAIRDNSLPSWANDRGGGVSARSLQAPAGILDGYTRQNFLNQPFVLEAAPEI